MAKSKKKVKKIKAAPQTNRPNKWFRDLIDKRRAFEAEGDNLEVGLIDRKILLEKNYLRESVKLLRKQVKGFEAKDGVRLDDITRLPPTVEAKVRKYAPLIRQEIASPHVIIRPRTPATRKAVAKYTGQTTIPGRKAFVVFTNAPDSDTVKTKVKIVTEYRTVKDKRGRKYKKPHTTLEVKTHVPGGVQAERLYMIEDFLKDDEFRPETFDELVKFVRGRMLRHMPKAYYVLQTSNHGSIGVLMAKEDILMNLQERYMGYDTAPSSGSKDDRGLIDVVTGFKLTSFTAEGARREYNERINRGLHFARVRRAAREKERRKTLKKLRLH